MSENRRKKPNKKGRNTDNDPNQEQTEPKNRKQKQINLDDPKERLRARIKQMQKDRAKGSDKCEENANHEY